MLIDGVVVDSESGAPIEGVEIMVSINQEFQEMYSNHISDSISKEERNKLIERNGGNRNGWSQFSNNEGNYIRFEPYQSNIDGSFSIHIFESCLFSIPETSLRFSKNGYEVTEKSIIWGSEKINVSLTPSNAM